MKPRLPLPIDSRPTHLADAYRTQRLAFWVIIAAGITLNVWLYAGLIAR